MTVVLYYMRLLAIFVFVAAFLSLKNQINSKAEYIHHETLSTCDELIETIEIFKNNPTKQNLSKTRKSYKKIQKYVAYYLPSDEKEINDWIFNKNAFFKFVNTKIDFKKYADETER